MITLIRVKIYIYISLAYVLIVSMLLQLIRIEWNEGAYVASADRTGIFLVY